MIKKIILVLGMILVVLIVIAFLKPEEYQIKREVIIDVKPEAVFPYLISMKKADQWMPWKEIDPKVETSYEGPEEGVGSISSWNSPGSMGTGKAEVIAVTENQLVKTKITYTKPMQMSQDSEFILTPIGETTQMTWIVRGKQPFFARLMCVILFMNMDKYVGGMFEKGLNNLKLSVERK
jgi:uncharacterized protein YndB with AHSA1/START domain